MSKGIKRLSANPINLTEDMSVSKKYYCIIEVRVPSGPEGWQILVNDKMKQTLEKLKATVEELGGKVCIRY
jgi:hypothetical protein